MQSIFGLGAAVGPILGILVWNHAGQAVWLWIALVGAVGALAVPIGVRARERQPAAAGAPVPEPAG
jgi:hypothetical protein